MVSLKWKSVKKLSESNVTLNKNGTRRPVTLIKQRERAKIKRIIFVIFVQSYLFFKVNSVSLFERFV